MDITTPRRSMRFPHTHTPKMFERKKSLFQLQNPACGSNLTKHRLPVVHSESDSDCDLGIISTLDSSSCDELMDQSVPKTPNQNTWRETRSHTRKLLTKKEDLKDFIKSPFMLKSNAVQCERFGTKSNPVTPQVYTNPVTPSSTHSASGFCTPGNDRSRARKSLASLIADAESCSSSLKDLNFDTDSESDSKENTPKKIRKSARLSKMTPKFASFKGILMEQEKNSTSSPKFLKSTPNSNADSTLSHTKKSSKNNKSTWNFGINLSSSPGSDKDISIEFYTEPNSSPHQNNNTVKNKTGTWNRHTNLNSSPKSLKKTPCGKNASKFSVQSDDDEKMLSPTQMQKTPHTLEVQSPPKMGHRRVAIETGESPIETEKNYNFKRLRNESFSEAPNSKNPKLDISAPKARLSLFGTDKLKEILSTKSFYPKTTTDLNASFSTKINTAIIEAKHTKRHPSYSFSHRRNSKRQGQINSGVRHKIRKPKLPKHRVQIIKYQIKKPNLMNFCDSMQRSQESTVTSQISDKEKSDPFSAEHKTINSLLSQWDEEEVPTNEKTLNLTEEKIHENIKKAENLICFNKHILEQTNTLFNPSNAIPVTNTDVIENDDSVIVELKPSVTDACIPVTNTEGLPSENVGKDSLGAGIDFTTSNSMPVTNMDGEKMEFLPVDGGYIVVESDGLPATQAEITDLDEIEREIQMLDDQLLQMAQKNNINPEVIIPEGTQNAIITDNSANSISNVGINCANSISNVGINCANSISIAEKNVESVSNIDNIIASYVSKTEQCWSQDSNSNARDISNGEQNENSMTLTYDMAVSSVVTVTKAEIHEEKPSKVFPIFDKNNVQTTINVPKTSKGQAKASGKKSILKELSDQYVIDAGQKRFGVTQCNQCGVIYQIGDPQDEHAHLVHHNNIDVLKFNGWKDECVVGSWGTSRCIRIRGTDPHWKKVTTLLERVVHPQLGYNAALPNTAAYTYTAYLYIEKRQIIGCLIVEPKTKAHKLIPGDIDCCSVETYTVKCGISRLWTHLSHRRKGIATNLINCMRASFLYGQALMLHEIAFSAPTTQGRSFARKYTQNKEFFVYVD